MDKRVSIRKPLRYLLLTLGALVMIFPFFWMISTAGKSANEAIQMPPVWFPPHYDWLNYTKAWAAAPFSRYFINSIIFTTVATLGEVVTSILAAFAFAKLQFYGKNLLFTLLLATMMVPGEILIIPNFVTLSELGLINTYRGLIIPVLASFFSVFILTQAFRSISNELYYAAKVDNCKDLQFLWQIVVPLTKSSVITVAILKVISCWNSFMWPLIVTNVSEMRTLPVGLQAFTIESGQHTQLLMAATTLTVIPIIIVYFLLQKYIIEGVSQSGLKG